MQIGFYSALAGLAFLSAQSMAFAQEPIPDVLRRVAPAVVQIRMGDDLTGSGFVYPTPRHVTTSYSVVNHHSDPTVVLAGGTLASARVVAWSEADDLAILELSSPARSASLLLEPAFGFAGQDVILLGYPSNEKRDAVDQPVQREVPTPRFGAVGLVSANQVSVDVDTWRGDHGAPILTRAGRVLGVVSGKVEQRLGLIDAASVTRIDALRKRIGKQGVFEAKLPAEKGVFSGVYVAPWQAYHQVGAGILTGYRYRWLAATLSLTFSHASFTPLDAERMRARWSATYEGYVTADWSYTKRRKLCFGAGAALNWTVFDVRQNGRDVDLEGKDSSQARADILFVLQDIEGPVLLGVTYAPVAQAARLDIGLVFGR